MIHGLEVMTITERNRN